MGKAKSVLRETGVMNPSCPLKRPIRMQYYLHLARSARVKPAI